MLKFIHWLEEAHPEIESIRNAPREKQLELANEFEDGNVEKYPMLAEKWEKGFRYLLNDAGIWQGYDQARAALSAED